MHCALVAYRGSAGASVMCVILIVEIIIQALTERRLTVSPRALHVVVLSAAPALSGAEGKDLFFRGNMPSNRRSVRRFACP